MNIESINHELLLFICFNLMVILMLAIDLGLLSREKNHTMSIKRAGYWTLIWISTAMLFALFIYIYDTNSDDPSASKTKSLEYIAAYLLEKSLSVDNLFVFIMIFQKYKIGPDKQPDILKWGILGAVILRAIMILMGAALVSQFTWILYVFGVFLIYTAVKMFLHKEADTEEEFNPETSRTFRFLKKFIPMTDRVEGTSFFIRKEGKLLATPMFVVLILIELSDVMFAFDSIPAVFSVSQNPFIVYTSNIFAILGLRSLYFMISGVMDLFEYLQTGVSVILGFVGIKMLLPLGSEYLVGTIVSNDSIWVSHEKFHIPISISLSVIVGILMISILASLPKYLQKKDGSIS
ncbi:MAG: TerC family protein [Spirochaetia bacterium]|nr:TerC family protein [Spirochaetia bacterium]